MDHPEGAGHCALQMAACTLVALYAREVDGAGAHIEGSMLEAAAAYIGDELLAAAVGAGTSMPAEQVIASAGRDAWFVTNAMDGSGDAEPLRSLAEALKDAQLVARSWFIELDDPGLGRRLFNGRFWCFQTAHLAEPRPAPRLAAI
jgi:crotonobetainyl-CoA:carnitine CoA-transferase CaiB-like acyl-CoA transferase